MLLHGDDVLATLEPGGSPPLVDAVEATIAGSDVTVSWTASDPDGDAVSAVVQYDTDGGWVTIATPGASVGAVTIDAAALVGGRESVFRVVASDGINRATADAAPLLLPDNPPHVAIASPIDGTQRPQGRPLDLWAFAHDAETDSPAISWFSDRDGPIGEGARVRVDSLSIGDHMITAVVTDDHGTSGSSAVLVSIGPPDGVGSEMMDAIASLFRDGPSIATDDGGLSTTTTALALAGLVIALLGIAYYIHDRRRGPVGAT